MKNIYIRILIVTFFVLIDLISKYFSAGIDVTIIDGFLSLIYVTNEGAAWGMLEGHSIFLILVGLIFIFGLSIFEYFEKDLSTINTVAYSFIVAGAIGNLYDRIVFGYVRDFISLDFINFPVFNIADSILVIGVILFSINVLFIKKYAKGIPGD